MYHKQWKFEATEVQWISVRKWVGGKHEAIMLQKLSIILLSSAQKITYYAFENCPLFLKLCQFIVVSDYFH